MRRHPLAAILFFAVSLNALCQQAADVPASREDIERYLQVVHSQELIRQMLDSIAKSMHEMAHEQYLKNRDKLPRDFEARMDAMVSDSWQLIPIDEMLQAMVPVYQKHFTKNDVDALVAFYSSETGQKLLREMPTIMGEAMQAMQPIFEKQIEETRQRIQKEVDAAAKKSPAGEPSHKPAQSPAVPPE